MRCDEYYEHGGAVLLAVLLREYRIIFTELLEDLRESPQVPGLPYVRPIRRTCGYRPLLPRQRRAAQALWRRWQEEAN